MARMPHRDDPREPWDADEVTDLYRPSHDSAPVPDLIEVEKLPGEPRVPFGFQVPRSARPRPRRGQRRRQPR